jgi:hypothetical protein
MSAAFDKFVKGRKGFSKPDFADTSVKNFDEHFTYVSHRLPPSASARNIYKGQ